MALMTATGTPRISGTVTYWKDLRTCAHTSHFKYEHGALQVWVHLKYEHGALQLWDTTYWKELRRRTRARTSHFKYEHGALQLWDVTYWKELRRRTAREPHSK
jgi:hypothetical protein